MKNTIFLRRKNRLNLISGKGQVPKNQIATLLHNLANLGYTLSPEVLEVVSTFSEVMLEKFYQTLIRDLKQMVGANRKFEPMYPNFPKQVMEMKEADLYLNAIMHYVGDWLGVRIMPDYQEKDRPELPLSELPELKVIGLGSEADFQTMIRNLIGANTSISETDKSDIAWAIEHYADDVEVILPDSIPQKETIAFVVAKLLESVENGEVYVSKFFKTATDVLRFAVSLSDGDVSLATPTKFKKFKRSERRLILMALENVNNPLEDMLRYKNVWIALGEILHPGEYAKRYPVTFAAFDAIRNKRSYDTFNSKVEVMLKNGYYAESVMVLAKRPGELARRLDMLLRNMVATSIVIDAFKKVADKISTPVLLQVMKHFKYRHKANDLRIVFPKGKVGKAVALDNQLEPLPKELTQKVVSICKTILIKRFSELPDLGGVYLDNDLSNFLVPFSQRSASKSLRTLVRGSRLPMPAGEKNTIRFFLWWKEGDLDGVPSGRIDVDLSAVMFDEDWNFKTHIGYTNLKSDDYKAAHSGDITSAPDGACEFIDIDIPSVLKHGGRYIVMNLFSYTGQKFVNMPECYAGWMMRSVPDAGAVFDPRTVVDKIDLTADTRICIPVILDLKYREVIWTDIALRRNPAYQNNVEGNLQGIALMGKAMTKLRKTNLYELFKLHALARGWLTTEKEDANTVFSVDEGVTPYDLETIMSEYMV